MGLQRGQWDPKGSKWSPIGAQFDPIWIQFEPNWATLGPVGPNIYSQTPDQPPSGRYVIVYILGIGVGVYYTPHSYPVEAGLGCESRSLKEPMLKEEEQDKTGLSHHKALVKTIASVG